MPLADPAISSDRDRVLDATDIVRLVGDHCALRAKGREYVCLCPFHDDHKPSMYVVPHKQIYHCFSCGAGGNAIDFVMGHLGMTFPEALAHLAERAGIELTPRSAEHRAALRAAASDRQQLAEASSFALSFFRGILRHGEHGAAARAMIERRGITPDMVEAFQLGAAPRRADGLARTVSARGLAPAPFVDAGLLKQRPGSDRYDAFRDRLVFPILDQFGRPIAFGGRRLDDEDQPKYLNSPESVLFDKSAVLYGLHRAFQPIRKADRAIVTEGYTDVVACHQAGFDTVVATLGTALTRKHAAQLRRICSRVVLLFDGDEAGQRAADRAIEVVFGDALDVRIAILPDGADPDDLLSAADGRERFMALVDAAEDALAYRFRRLETSLRERGVSDDVRAQAIESELVRLLELGLDELSPIRRQTVVRRLARLGDVDEQTIVETLRRQRGPRRGAAQPTSTKRDSTSESELEPISPAMTSTPAAHLLGCLLAAPELPDLVTRLDPAADFREDLDDALAVDAYASRRVGRLAESIRSLLDALGDRQVADPSAAELLHRLEDPEDRALASALVAEVERVTDGEAARLAEHWTACLQRVRRTLARVRGSDAAPPTPSPPAELADRLALARERHGRLGGNPLALPRPVESPLRPDRPAASTVDHTPRIVTQGDTPQ